MCSCTFYYKVYNKHTKPKKIMPLLFLAPPYQCVSAMLRAQKRFTLKEDVSAL